MVKVNCKFKIQTRTRSNRQLKIAGRCQLISMQFGEKPEKQKKPSVLIVLLPVPMPGSVCTHVPHMGFNCFDCVSVLFVFQGSWLQGCYDGKGTLVSHAGFEYRGIWRKGRPLGKIFCFREERRDRVSISRREKERKGKKDARTANRDSEIQKARISKNTKFQSQARMFLTSGYILVATCVKESFIHTVKPRK